MQNSMTLSTGAKPLDPMTRGILLSVAAFALFVCGDAIYKQLLTKYALPQLFMIQAVTTFTLFLLIGFGTGRADKLKPKNRTLHGIRAVLATATGLGMLIGFQSLPLADAYAIVFSAPLIVTALSVPMLREQVGWRRWSAVLVGFIGVLVMLAPGGGDGGPALNWAALAVVMSAFAYATSMLMVRKAGGKEHPLAFGLVGTGSQAILMGVWALLVIGWQPMQMTDFLLMLLVGVIAGGAVLSIMGAYQSAPAAVVAPFQYTQMLWGVLLGYLLFGDLPGTRTWIGCAIVMTAGLYILWRETVRARDVAMTNPSGPKLASIPVAIPGEVEDRR